MLLEIKDRKAALNKRVNEIWEGSELRVIQSKCHEILESEKSEIVSDTKWLQELVEATQNAIFQVGTEELVDPEDQEGLFRNGMSLTNDNGIISSTNILHDVTVIVLEDESFTVSYQINRTLIPWAEHTEYKIYNYQFQPEEAAILLERNRLREEIITLNDERRGLEDKARNMEDILLRVETDLLVKQVRSDGLGESSLDLIKELMGKYLNNKALPEAMTFIEEGEARQ